MGGEVAERKEDREIRIRYTDEHTRWRANSARGGKNAEENMKRVNSSRLIDGSFSSLFFFYFRLNAKRVSFVWRRYARLNLVRNRCYLCEGVLYSFFTSESSCCLLVEYFDSVEYVYRCSVLPTVR